MPVPLRVDFDAQTGHTGPPNARRPGRRRGDFWPWRRIAEALRGTEAAKIGGVTLRIVRD